jgi:hypothetical protein
MAIVGIRLRLAVMLQPLMRILPLAMLWRLVMHPSVMTLQKLMGLGPLS